MLKLQNLNAHISEEDIASATWHTVSKTTIKVGDYTFEITKHEDCHSIREILPDGRPASCHVTFGNTLKELCDTLNEMITHAKGYQL